MALPGITINITPGSLGTSLGTYDFISGIICYSSSLPSGWTNNEIQYFGSIADVENASIVSTLGTDVSVVWFALKNYFNIFPNGLMYVMFSSSSAWTFTEAQTMSDYSQSLGSNVRQIAVLVGSRWLNTTDVATLQGIANTLKSEIQNVEFLYCPNFSGTTGVDCSASNAPNVAVLIGTDQSVGGFMKTGSVSGLTYNHPAMVGPYMGILAANAISDSPAWVGGQFGNISNGSDFVTPGIGSTANYIIGSAILTTLDNYALTFMRTLNGYPGTYIMNSRTATVAKTAYSKVELQRTIDKIYRGIYVDIAPWLSRRLTVQKGTGYLAYSTAVEIESSAENTPKLMKANNDISDYKVIVNPFVNVVASNSITITVNILPSPVLEWITVNLSYNLNL
jgi:hypothetical protein